VTTHPGPNPNPPALARGLAGLWLLALLLALAGLGGLPLRDWDEGIVARVALEASQRPWPDVLMPVYWGEPYLNKPPGLHLLIAGAIELWRSTSGSPPGTLPPEWLLRLVPAVLSSTVVPLVGLVQARLRPHPSTVALATAAMALTLMPLARHGRLVMLDGTQLAAVLVIWWAVLTPDHRRGSLLIHGSLMGLAGSALLLLKAPVAFPLLAATLALRAWDQDLQGRQWRWLLLGLAMGLLPGLAWHGLHALERGPDALQMWLGQGFARVHQQLEGHSGGPIVPITEVLEGGWPWLALWPGAMGLAWRERRTRAGRWCLGTTAITAALVLPLGTQLPWYSLLLWPPFVLCCGPVLVWLMNDQPALKPAWPAITRRVPWFWALLGSVLLVLAMIAVATGNPSIGPLSPVAGSGGLALLLGGALLLARPARRRETGVIVLVAGLWGALLLLLTGPFWLWELNESWSVRPVAQEVRLHPTEPVHLWKQNERPSLNWYAERRLRRRKNDTPKAWEGKPSLLITAEATPPSIKGVTCTPLPLPPPEGPSSPSGHVFRCTKP